LIIVAYGSPTASEETLVVSSSAIGITADLCGDGNETGALCQVLDQSVYVTFNGPLKTPDSGDFLFTAGTIFYVRVANRVRFIRVTTDARVKVQAME
jgi:hypothetical protein